MMNEDVYQASGFVRSLHPAGSLGRVVLNRKIARKPKRSQLSATELHRTVQHTFGLTDLHCSVSSFQGLPLLLNFAATRAIYISFPLRSSVKRSTFDLSSEVNLFLVGKNIPTPSAVLYDGQKVYFLWLVDKPIIGREIWRFYLLQEALKEVFSEYPDQPLDMPRVNTFLPLAGTRNSEADATVRIDEATWRGPCSSDLLSSVLLKQISADRRETLEFYATVLTELEELFHARWWGMEKSDQNLAYWLSYFGIALKPFVTSGSLRNELRAVAESVTGQRWKDISPDYKGLIENVSAQIDRNEITINGEIFSLSRRTWRETIEDNLFITIPEVSDLGLYELCSHRECLARHINPYQEKLESFGYPDWVPKERLLMRLAA